MSRPQHGLGAAPVHSGGRTAQERLQRSTVDLLHFTEAQLLALLQQLLRPEHYARIEGPFMSMKMKGSNFVFNLEDMLQLPEAASIDSKLKDELCQLSSSIHGAYTRNCSAQEPATFLLLLFTTLPKADATKAAECPTDLLCEPNQEVEVSPPETPSPVSTPHLAAQSTERLPCLTHERVILEEKIIVLEEEPVEEVASSEEKHVRYTRPWKSLSEDTQKALDQVFSNTKAGPGCSSGRVFLKSSGLEDALAIQVRNASLMRAACRRKWGERIAEVYFREQGSSMACQYREDREDIMRDLYRGDERGQKLQPLPVHGLLLDWPPYYLRGAILNYINNARKYKVALQSKDVLHVSNGSAATLPDDMEPTPATTSCTTQPEVGLRQTCQPSSQTTMATWTQIINGSKRVSCLSEMLTQKRPRRASRMATSAMDKFHVDDMRGIPRKNLELLCCKLLGLQHSFYITSQKMKLFAIENGSTFHMDGSFDMVNMMSQVVVIACNRKLIVPKWLEWKNPNLPRECL